ncbi:hypothetical protein KCP76_11290 [Salmonella enterica subsp. enterica serovar Weltevreden]|nr:hypothetical protein KCP76_11290 [Salmonella enterica subsp. enterica serovar Weltevreden]
MEQLTRRQVPYRYTLFLKLTSADKLPDAISALRPAVARHRYHIMQYGMLCLRRHPANSA